MSRTAVLDATGEPTRRFRKSPDSPELTDAYDDIGMHVYYDDSETVVFVEAGQAQNVKLLFDGMSLLDTPVTEVISEISKLGSYLEKEDGHSFVFGELGISLWRSDPGREYFEAVGVARSSYFNV